MNRLILPAALLAASLGSTAALAQTNTQTTTTESTPSGTTQTTTTQSNDGYTQYRRTITTTRHYNAGVFMAPSGFAYRRYALGQRVDGELLGTDYVLTRYGEYGLEAPPSAGLVWIRVGDDALLVDHQSGEVVESEYGLFSD